MIGMSRRAAAVFAGCALGIATRTAAQTPPYGCAARPYPPVVQTCTSGNCINPVPDIKLMTSNDFQVSFSGIICIRGGSEAYPPEPKRQAMLIHGNVFTKRHTTMLGVHGADRQSLREASGRHVSCDHTYCWTAVSGLQLRIVGDDGKPPDGARVEEDNSFCDLVPRLKRLLDYRPSGSTSAPPQKYALCGDSAGSTGGMPKSPVDGCFDIEGGRLIAYPYKSFQQGMFVFADGHQVGPLQFADVVAWHGHTTGTAKLQIKSAATGFKWQTVKSKVDHEPLLIAVANLGHVHHTTTHFVLNEKLYENLKPHLPEIVVDMVPPCDPSRVSCYTSLTSLIDVAGCGNTRP